MKKKQVRAAASGDSKEPATQEIKVCISTTRCNWQQRSWQEGQQASWRSTS